MCGIAGGIGESRPGEERIAATLSSLRHRGPDAEGSYRAILAEHQVTLLNRRLAIIDLDSRADQPIEYDDCVLTFNGELYNYVELRQQLVALGRSFRTRSDTEVVLQAYREWGLRCLDRFEGMWAFALLDEREGRLILCRDPFGEKPLYLLDAGGTLYFASEVKALASLSGRALSPDPRQICSYLVNGYRSLYKRDRTFYQDVRELPAGTYLVIDDHGWAQERYWRLQYAPGSMDLKEAVDGARERLLTALRIRLRADVPLAFCLSGGIDSSTLAGLAMKELGHDVHAFSIVDRDPRYNELANMQDVVRELGCPHEIIRIDTTGFLDRMERLVDAHDTPVSTISYYVHSFISEAVADRGFKVALSGTGADELFTGYYDHYSYWLAAMSERDDLQKLVDDWRGSYGAFVRNPVLQDPMVFAKEPERRDHIYLDRQIFEGLLVHAFEEGFVERKYTDDPLRNRMLNELFHEVVPVILHEDDANSMMYSVENRSPYLDRPLAEFLYTVPNEHLIQSGYVKWILRSVAQGYVPDSVRLNKQKRGFNASILSVLDRDDPDTRDRLLAQGPIFEYVDRDKFIELFDGDFTRNSYSKFLFAFVSAKLFLESNLASGGVPEPS